MTTTFKTIAASLMLFLFSATTNAQTEITENQDVTVIIAPLFQYPEAPETLTSLQEKADWLIENFWNGMDFKQASVDQSALNHAFGVYVAPMRWADREKIEKSIATLLKKIEKNPALLYQFTKAAEENLYGRNASVWIDEAYLPFLEALTESKKLKEPLKVRYRHQLNVIKNCLSGQEAQPFDYIDKHGAKQRFRPVDNRWIIIEFGTPSCYDCRLTRLRLDSNIDINRLIKDDKLEVFFIIPDSEPDWEKNVNSYSHTWSVGIAQNVDDIYDLRLQPSFYVIGPDRKIVLKNVGLDETINAVVSATQPQNR